MQTQPYDAMALHPSPKQPDRKGPHRPDCTLRASPTESPNTNQASEPNAGLIPKTAQDWLNSRHLLAIALHVAHNHPIPMDDHEDLLQEVRIALWSVGLEQKVNATWVFHVALHKAADLARKVRPPCREYEPPEATSNAEANSELLYLLHSRADRLPLELRAFYELYYRKGLSQRTVAEHLGVSRATVRWRDRRCRQILRDGSEHQQSR